MARDPKVLIYVGIKNAIVALDERSGEEVWSTKLRGSDFVTVFWDGEALLAANSGEVWRLDPNTGEEIWHNRLTGLGRGLVSLASTRAPMHAGMTATAAAVAKKRQEQAAAAAGAAAAS